MTYSSIIDNGEVIQMLTNIANICRDICEQVLNDIENDAGNAADLVQFYIEDYLTFTDFDCDYDQLEAQMRVTIKQSLVQQGVEV
jgi:hypothetical protein